MPLNLIFKSLSSIAILSRNNYYQVSPMCEHSKEVLLSWDLENKDLHIDAFLSSLYLFVVAVFKKGEESESNNWPVLNRNQYFLGILFFSKSYESQSEWAYESQCPT